jgi:ADP-glucose pyrophosphorylase
MQELRMGSLELIRVKLDGTVVCQSAIIGKKSELKDCEVAGNNKVEEGTKAKNQQFSKLMVSGE